MTPEEELKVAAEKYAKARQLPYYEATLQVHNNECLDVNVLMKYKFEKRVK